MSRDPVTGRRKRWLCRHGFHSWGVAPADLTTQRRLAKMGVYACDWWAGGPAIRRCRHCGARG